MGFRDYQAHYRDIIIPDNSQKTVTAFNELWFIIGDPVGIQVSSYYGWFNVPASGITENSHMHRGEIIIKNPDTVVRRIKFIQFIIIN